MRSLLPAALLVTGLSLTLAGCGGSSSTPTTPTTPTPTPTLVTDTYNGDLVTGGTVTHTFSVGVGTVTATLTNITPLSTAAVGMIIGTWDGTTCTTVLQNDNTKVGTSLVGTAQGTVNLCLKFYDVGNVPSGSTYSYTATVAHY